MKKIALYIGFAFFSICSVTGQDLGQNPSDINWHFIESKNVKVIYPEGQIKAATRITNTIDYINQNNTFSVGKKSRKIDLILQTNQVVSNGFVTLSPFRSEFFATDFQDFNQIGSLDWLDALAVHEYRHVLQYNNGNQGFTKLFYYLFGQNGWAGALQLSLPNWYFEGDAVVTETLLSNAGRGRTPSFFIEQKANLLNNHDYSYKVSRNGSFTKLLPNHYPLGYAICNYTRNKYGPSTWKQVLADAGSYKGIFYPFRAALKKQTGVNLNQIYRATYADLKDRWNTELKQTILTENKPLTTKSKCVTNYQFPHFLNDGSLVALKSSFQKTTQLIKIQNDKETVLTDIGITTETFLSENNNRIAWTEFETNPRRTNKNYNKILTFDLHTGVKKVVCKKSKYFSPQLNASGEKLVVVQANENLENNLLILDVETGEILEKIANPENDFISQSKWATDEKAIIYIAKRNSKIALLKYNLDSKTTLELTAWSANTISAPEISGEKVYFTASYSGIDNIYSVNEDGTKEIKKISSVKIGAYQSTLNPEGTELVFNEMTDKGFVLSKLKLYQAINQIVVFKEPKDNENYNVQTNEYEKPIFDKIPNTLFEEKEYKGVFNGIKFHSWLLGSNNNNPSLTLNFANTLSHFSADAGLIYNTNEKKSNFIGNIRYSKWLFELNLKADLLNRSVPYLLINPATSGATLNTTTYNEYNLGVGASVPLQWYSGNYGRTFKISSLIVNHRFNAQNTLVPLDLLLGKSFNALESQLSFSNIRQKALQNTQPRFGQQIIINFNQGLAGRDIQKIATRARVYFPGLAVNHGITLDFAWQQQLRSNSYLYQDDFFYSRGYLNIPNDKAYKMALNYQLPLAYPDWGFGGFTYFKRIRFNAFYDLGGVSFNKAGEKINSFGGELIFDNTFYNIVPISLGFRLPFVQNKIFSNSNTAQLELFLAIGL